MILAPVFGLHLGARAARDERSPCQIAQGLAGSLLLECCETQIPIGGIAGCRVT